MNDEGVNNSDAIYSALSLPGDDPPDYSLSFGEKDIKTVKKNDEGGKNGNNDKEYCFSPEDLGKAIEVLAYYGERIKNGGDPATVIKLYHALMNRQTQQDDTGDVKKGDGGRNSLRRGCYRSYLDVYSPYDSSGQSNTYEPSSGSRSVYGLDDDPDLDEWMFFDLMDDD